MQTYDDVTIEALDNLVKLIEEKSSDLELLSGLNKLADAYIKLKACEAVEVKKIEE